jgi:ABC-type Mn2+/Zn2+ transport system permease subunit
MEVWSSLFEFEFARIAFVCTILVSLICGLLSPIIVLKERSYIGDTLAHLVFPGIVLGYFLSNWFSLPLWICLFSGAAFSGFVGQLVSEFFRKTLKAPQDAASVVTLSGFFAIGVVVVSRLKGTRIDMDRILFGDVLTLGWDDALILGVVLLLSCVGVIGFRKHWDAWISDPEFAEIAGFRIRLVERLFPVLITSIVLAGMFTVGGLMISALLVLPSVLFMPGTVVALPVVLASLVAGLGGFVLGFELDWPVGPCIVVAGLILVLCKALVIKAKR